MEAAHRTKMHDRRSYRDQPDADVVLINADGAITHHYGNPRKLCQWYCTDLSARMPTADHDPQPQIIDSPKFVRGSLAAGQPREDN